MSSGVLTLANFLLARIAEDENRVREFMGSEDFPKGMVVRKHWRIQLAECEAKRRIVEEVSFMKLDTITMGWVLQQLALPYADHPDYRPDWRPFT